MTENSPPKQPKPIRARRWSGSASPRPRPYRMAMRLIGIPAAAVAGVLIYRGVRDRLVLPECASGRAKHSLADVLKQLQLEPTQYEPIKTVSTSKDQVVCNAVLPLPGGGSVVADYTFYWQGSSADMKYSISRKRP
ncbi:MAG: hypothetical protein WA850_09655 [Xanthobacteraceae bacterium]